MHKYTIDLVKEIFKKENCVLLSKVYISNSLKLKYKCSCGNMSEISLTAFLRGRRCKKCGIIKSANKNRERVSREVYSANFCKELKELIRIRDNHTCQMCGIEERILRRRLNVHHINYNKQDLKPSNLISLCDSCRSTTNFNRKKWETQLKTKLGIIENKNMEMVLHDIKYLIQGIKKVKKIINNEEKVKTICDVLLVNTDKLFNDILRMSEAPRK